MNITAFNIIMFICIYPILPIMCLMLRNETKPKKNIIIGVTLPSAAIIGEEVGEICKRYRKNLIIALALLSLLLTAVFLVKYSSVAMTYYMVWLIAAIIVPFVVYSVSHRELRLLKVERGWRNGVAGKILVDTEAAALPKKRISVWWFAPPFIMSIAPVVYTAVYGSGSGEFWTEMAAYLTDAAIVALFYFFYRIIFRQRADVVGGDARLNIALTAVRRHSWSAAWLWTAWLTGLFSLGVWRFLYKPLPLIIMALVYSTVLIYIVLRAEFKTRAAQQKLTEKSGLSSYADEDDYWINGMFYYNPNDSHVMINKRIGFGATINVASIWGKTIIAFSVLCLMALPLTGIWMMQEEFTPVIIETDDLGIRAYHLSKEYDIAYGDIYSAELLNELPDATKVNGTAFGTLLKGKFIVPDLGVCQVCLNPEVPPFILIYAKSGTYILGAEDTAQTQAIYNALISALR
ncbi:MAG: hypothetical protein AB7C97_07125 [Oscillospiraceae bacterium]